MLKKLIYLILFSNYIYSINFTFQEKEWIKNHPIIKVGAGPDWAPIDFVDNNKYSGIAKNYLDLISQKSGLRFKIIVDIWANNLKKIKSKEIDMLDAVYYNDERATYMNFSEPYFELLDYFFIRKDIGVRTLSDLNGKIVAMPKGYAHGIIIHKEFPKIKILDVNTFDEAIDAVTKRRADFLFDTYASISYKLQKDGISNIIPFQSYRGKNVNKIHITTRKDYKILISIINKSLLSITPKEKKQIVTKWFSIPPDYTFLYQIAFILILILMAIMYWNRKLSLEIAKRKAIEKELLEFQKELELQTQKAILANKAKSEFLSNMSHEIRTPMNAIIGFTELLDEELNEPTLKSYVKTIKSAGNTLLLLINDILDLSKIEAGKLVITKNSTNLRALVDDIKSIFIISTKQRGLDLIVEIDESLPSKLLLDEIRVRQILINLIGNSVKFTEKGYIKLSIESKKNIDNNNFNINIKIEDSGIGIPKEHLQSIFRVFEQKDGQDNRKFGGTGLGLAISKKLTELMGGIISLESTVDKGSTFSVNLLDVEESNIDTYLEESRDTKDFIFQPNKILIVDDIKNNRDLIINNFKDTNIEVIEANDGVEAIAQYKKYKPALILMDIRMPNMDGYEATRIIKQNFDVPIISLTASVMQDEHKNYKGKNFDGFLRKPILKYDLFSELAKFLPYNTKEFTQKKDDNTIKLDNISSQNIKKIIDTINDINPLYQKVMKSNNINDMKIIAQEIEILGDKYNIIPLQNYAKKLNDAIESFDIGTLQTLLIYYSELEQQIIDNQILIKKNV